MRIASVGASRSALIDGWIRIQSSHWFMPLLLVLCALVLSYVMVAIDARLGDAWFQSIPWLFVNHPEGARAVLATVAGSMITVAGVTFSMMLLLV